MKNNKFICASCQKSIPTNTYIATKHRNHCPFCLFSVHVDIKSGDRKAICKGLMEPIGLTFKHEGWDKQGKPRIGELMIVHQCKKCKSFSINRLAADDDPNIVVLVFNKSKSIAQETKDELKQAGISLLGETDKQEVLSQLFGKDNWQSFV